MRNTFFQKHLFARAAAVVACVLATLIANAAYAGTSVVSDVRLGNANDRAQLIVRLSRSVKPTVFTLSNPDRVVIDLPQSHLQGRVVPVTKEGPVRNVRTAQRKSSVRVVADLTSPLKPITRIVPVGRAFDLIVELSEGSNAKADASVSARSQPQAVKSTDAMFTNARDIVVAVDAGHGGEDPGAIGRRSTREKDVTLAIARELKERIDREPGMRAVLTRDGDYFIPLRGRIQRAREHRADMFVSVHADSYIDRSVSGSSVYVLSQHGATSEAARWLAERENSADLIGGVSLEDKDPVLASVLLDLSQGASMTASIDAAEQVLRQLDRVGNVRRPQVQHAGFVVLKSPDIPSMLIETAFISNPSEEAKLAQRAHQERLATAICAGIRTYFRDNPPPGTRFAQLRGAGTGTQLAAKSDAGARALGAQE